MQSLRKMLTDRPWERLGQLRQERGVLLFGLIWLGQLVSLVGSGVTEFGLGVWVFQRTGAATDYALIALCISLPHVLVGPVAGPLVDRLDRRLVMLLSDSGAALGTLVIAMLAWGGQLATWHVYAAVLLTSACAAVQYPAYAALVSRLVPREHLGRANGLIELSWSVSMIAAPLIAAVLIERISLTGILILDLLTFGAGAAALLLARVPATASAPVLVRADGHGEAHTGHAGESFAGQVRDGWAYITTRPGLLGLLLFSVVVSLSAGTFNALFSPMILSTQSATVLGTLAAVGGFGMLAGGLVLSAWGGPRRQVTGSLGASLVLGLALVMIGVQPSWIVLAVAVGLYFGCLPFVNGCEQTVWQTTVPDSLHGRVFSTRRAVEHGAAILAYLAAGTIADRLAEPLLAANGALAPSVGLLLGTGPGRGIGLLLVMMGLVAVVAALSAAFSSRVRRVEDTRSADDRVEPLSAAA